MSGLFGALTDADFWKAMASPVEQLSRYGQMPGEADRIAEDLFPNSARDASTKNAFRHALGTGMVAQHLGGGKVGELASKGLGYLWEGFNLPAYIADPRHRTDTHHDLNANAIGARLGAQTGSQQELIDALRRMAQDSRVQAPPSAISASPGHLTRSVR